MILAVSFGSSKPEHQPVVQAVANLLMGGPVTADTICALLEQRQIAGTVDAADRS